MHTRQGLAQGFALFDSGAAAQAALRTIANLPCAVSGDLYDRLSSRSTLSLVHAMPLVRTCRCAGCAGLMSNRHCDAKWHGAKLGYCTAHGRACAPRTMTRRSNELRACY